MLVNHRYKFLFVHIQKTAGMSITGKLESIQGTTRIANQHSFVSHIDLKPYEEYFKFCFVRNPWDRLVSWWKMMKRKDVHNDFSRYLLQVKTFEEFLDLTDVINEDRALERILDNYPKSIAFNQLDYISDENGRIGVDYIGRFESLRDDFKGVCQRLNIPFSLTHINKGESVDYRSFYNDETIQKVSHLYQRDIEYFGYQFNQS